MLRLLNLALSRGTRVLYRHATLTAAPGERIGLVGPNGCGKSTLFAAMLGDLSPEDGDIETPPRDRIAHVAQSFVADNVPAVDFVLGGHAPLIAARAALAEAEKAGDDMRLAQAHANLAELNEGAIVAQARTILAGLGFSQTDVDRPVYDFSGGWRNRIALARALMCPADLLLLDEPTNHLDIDSLIWLENWLRRVEATVVIISHDREFLDRAVTTIWSVEDDTVCRYAGNYSAFESQRIEKLRLQDAAAKAYEREASHLSSFIERFRAKATKARQAQSRIKMLEKLNIPVEFIEGLRYTSADIMRVVEMVLVGQVNTELVGFINKLGGKAVGLSGVSGDIYHCHQRDEVHGYVGDIDYVDPKPIFAMLDAGYIPVIAPVGTDGQGHTFNINGDTAAGKLASALGAEKLVILTDIEGLCNDIKIRDVISYLNIEDVKALKDKGTIAGGMIPKVDCCVQAIEEGVTSVNIIDGRKPHSVLYEAFTNEGTGTTIGTAQPSVGIKW